MWMACSAERCNRPATDTTQLPPDLAMSEQGPIFFPSLLYLPQPWTKVKFFHLDSLTESLVLLVLYSKSGWQWVICRFPLDEGSMNFGCDFTTVVIRRYKESAALYISTAGVTERWRDAWYGGKDVLSKLSLTILFTSQRGGSHYFEILFPNLSLVDGSRNRKFELIWMCSDIFILKHRLAFGWQVTEGSSVFGQKFICNYKLRRVELSGLWHKSSEAVWLILLHPSRGHKPPKTRLRGGLNIILSKWPRPFSHAGGGTPPVSSTLVRLLLLKSPHQPGLHPAIAAHGTISVTAFLRSSAFVCAWQPVQSVQVLLSSSGITRSAQTRRCLIASD